jgi:hypothetical protein
MKNEALIRLLTFGVILLCAFPAYGNSYGQSQSLMGIKIMSPIPDQEVPVGEFTISGISIDDENSNCGVYMDWNHANQFQKAMAAGPNGENDYSIWNYTYTSAFHPITEGVNELTSKLSCLGNPSLEVYHTVNVTGVSKEEQQQRIAANGGTPFSGPTNGGTPTENPNPVIDDPLKYVYLCTTVDDDPPKKDDDPPKKDDDPPKKDDDPPKKDDTIIIPKSLQVEEGPPTDTTSTDTTSTATSTAETNTEKKSSPPTKDNPQVITDEDGDGSYEDDIKKLIDEGKIKFTDEDGDGSIDDDIKKFIEKADCP